MLSARILQPSASRAVTARALHDARRFAHRAQHRGLALGLGSAARLLHFAFESDLARPPLSAFRALRARFDRLIERDFRNAEQGLYPPSLLFQFPVVDYARLLPRAVIEARGVVRRRRARRVAEVPEWAAAGARYPAYYLQNFHWQADGWLSERSARFYDFSVELLFGGTADVMRRMAIPPVVETIRDIAAGRRRFEAYGRGVPRVVDFGCGTGRYLLQLARALDRAAPSSVELVGLDLSSYYLDFARRLFGRHHLEPQPRRVGRRRPPEGAAGQGAAGPHAEFVEADAEKTPFAAGSCAVVTSVFLLHELPTDVRRRVLAEAYRVLAPGGRLVVLDAAQPFESAEIAPYLEAFPRLYHEPYFRSYLRADLADLAREVGFATVSIEPHFVAKLLVAERPGA